MKALAIVHAEAAYEGPAVDAAFGEIGRYLDANPGVAAYFLGVDSTPENPGPIYPSIRRHFDRMHVVPFGLSLQSQLLQAKRTIITDKITSVELSGVSGGACVLDFYHVLKGTEGADVAVEDYRNHWAKMGRAEKFEEVFTVPIKARIIRELTVY